MRLISHQSQPLSDPAGQCSSELFALHQPKVSFQFKLHRVLAFAVGQTYTQSTRTLKVWTIYNLTSDNTNTKPKMTGLSIVRKSGQCT